MALAKQAKCLDLNVRLNQNNRKSVILDCCHLVWTYLGRINVTSYYVVESLCSVLERDWNNLQS
jgi:hypothetical protein